MQDPSDLTAVDTALRESLEEIDLRPRDVVAILGQTPPLISIRRILVTPVVAVVTPEYRPKPNAEVYQDLVFKRWWTNTDGKTSAKGTFATRGFLGDYDIEVKHGGKSKTVRTALSKDGSKVECVLE